MGNILLTKTSSFKKAGLIVVMGLFALIACQPESKMPKPLPPGVPENAIYVKDDLYMIPVKDDSSGCMMYRAFSPKGAVVAAIFYRTIDGRFVMDKSHSDCD